MKKKILVSAVAMVLLVACGKKGIDNLPEKSWQSIKTFYSDTGISKWESADAKTSGDNTQAKITLSKRTLLLGNLANKDKQVAVDFPESIIDVTAMDNNVATYKESTDLSTIKVTLPKHEANVTTLDLFGDLTTNFQKDLTTNKYLSYSNSSKKLGFKFNNKTKESSVGGSYEATYNDMSNNFTFTHNQGTTSIVGSGGTSSSNVINTIDAKFRQDATATKNIWTVDWKNLDDKLLDGNKLIGCVNDVATGANTKNIVTTKKGANCLLDIIKTSPIGTLKSTGAVESFNANIDADGNKFKYSTGKITSAIDMQEVNGLIGLNVTADAEDIKVEMLETTDNSIKAAFPMIKSYLPTALNYQFKLDGIKRSELQKVTDIAADNAKLNVGDSHMLLNINYTTTMGFLKVNINANLPKDTLISDFSGPKAASLAADSSILIQIENFDKWVAPIKKQWPQQSSIFVQMIKGLGVADKTNANVLDYKLILKDGNVLINGNPLPKF